MTNRKKIAKAILDHKGPFFSLDRIVKQTGIRRAPARLVLNRFIQAGLVQVIKRKATYDQHQGPPFEMILYCWKNRKAMTQEAAPTLKENTAMDRMWTVIRNKMKVDGCFTRKDLLVLAGAKNENARWFMKMLRRAGYIHERTRGEWILVNDPGPRRPYAAP